MDSILSVLEQLPPDPILGVTEAFKADSRPNKINLGVGIYLDEAGKICSFEALRQAEKAIHSGLPPLGYLPIDGFPDFNRLVQALVLGEASAAIKDGRAVTVQTLGGTGALRLGADLVRLASPASEVWISDPSWENHNALFTKVGFKVQSYPYFDARTNALNFDGMLSALSGLKSGSVVVLHACCHNPTGIDLGLEEWRKVRSIVEKRNLVPFFDFAYQGLGAETDEDARPLREFADAGIPLLVASSFSKSCSMYGERVGALTVVAASKPEAQRLLSQLKRLARTNYSNPPSYGARLVAQVLGSPDLRTLWEKELGAMRARIKEMRTSFITHLQSQGVKRDLSHIQRQIGMFSYTGFSSQFAKQIREEHGVYLLETGRICVAALNKANVQAAASATAQVLSKLGQN